MYAKIKYRFISIFSSFLVLLHIQSVRAQGFGSQPLSTIIRNSGIGLFDIWQTYLQIPDIVDFILMYALFLGISREATRERRFPPQAHWVLAIAFAIGGLIGLHKLNTTFVLLIRPVLLLGAGYFIAQRWGVISGNIQRGLGLLIFNYILNYVALLAPGLANGFPAFGLILAFSLLIGLVLLIAGGLEMLRGGVSSIGDTTRATASAAGDIGGATVSGGRRLGRALLDNTVGRVRGRGGDDGDAAGGDAAARQRAQLAGQIRALEGRVQLFMYEVNGFENLIVGFQNLANPLPAVAPGAIRRLRPQDRQAVIVRARDLRNASLQLRQDFMNVTADAQFNNLSRQTRRLFATIYNDYLNENITLINAWNNVLAWL